MFRADVITEDIHFIEPKLSLLLQNDNSDFKNEILVAKKRVAAWLKSQRLLLRKVCLPYSLTIDTTSTSDDNVERTRLVVQVAIANIITSDSTFTLYGTNDSGTTLVSVGTLKVPASSSGDFTFSFHEPYKRYKVTCDQTITSTIFLTEISFELPVVYFTLGVIMGGLSMGTDSIWSEKATEYDDKAYAILNEFSFGYDDDDDGDYDDNEKYQTSETTLKA